MPLQATTSFTVPTGGSYTSGQILTAADEALMRTGANVGLLNSSTIYVAPAPGGVLTGIAGATNVSSVRLVAIPAATVITANGNGPDVNVGSFREIDVEIEVTAISGTSPSVTFAVDVKDATSGQYTQTAIGAAITAVGNQIIALTSGFGDTVRVRYIVTGTTPSATVNANIVSK
ncbi:MAG: hypothetical protein NVSMB31_01190 [Vulcanimicrobiaceae bacterium]